MKKNEFILIMLANNVSIFQNRASLAANIKDMIETAEIVFDEADKQLALKEPKTLKSVK